MRAVSLFSGAGGFEIGFDRAGIETVLQAENDPWCLEVLARHWPDVERVTDVRQVRSRGTGVDLVYGGYPCQDVSVAGKRAGFGGSRSGLWSEFARVVSELRPRWLCAENVPGVLSSARGRDFGTVLGNLDDLGYGVAWTVLDARYFGVPQRRRRVFLVGCAGNADAAAQVLALCESGCGHPAPSCEPQQGTAGSIGTRIGRSGEPERRDVTLVVAGALRASDGHHGHSSPRGDGADNLIAQTLSSSYAKTTASGGSHGTQAPVNVLTIGEGVRRLTPLECERLMGWPDEHTRYTADEREIPDSHRYRLCGNGVVSTCAEWLGHRLVAVDRLLG